MSLLSAIVDYYDNGSSSDLDALRALLGVDQLYADVMPGNVARPYCVLGEMQTESLSESKSAAKRNRVLRVTVAFAVFAQQRQQAEDILEALEEVYLSQQSQLTIEDRTHLATRFSNRQSLYEAEGWQGQLELAFDISKDGN